MDGHLQKRRGARAQVAGGDASVASTLAALLLASHTFHVVHAGSRTARWKLLAWDTTSHGGHMPEGYHHLTYEDRCQIYALTQSGPATGVGRRRPAHPELG